MARALEDFCNHKEGVVYRFNWIFPSEQIARAGIGFGGDSRSAVVTDSYAHLSDAEIDARLPCELRDHPLLLLPLAERRALLSELEEGIHAGAEKSSSRFVICDYLRHGNLSHKNNQIFEALLAAYEGDFLRVLRHVQVERFYYSRRYRLGTARVEPQMAVDGRTRQVTADRSLGALPTTLQNVALYELDGALTWANRGLIEYADLLKRPLETYKYLLNAVEDGRVALENANLFFDMVLIASVNELHLNAFMESPEWMSFRGRFELVRVPYLIDFAREEAIYSEQIDEVRVGKHIAPHATEVAALWAVLTRMHKPDLSRYEGDLRELLSKLTPLEKAMLYAKREAPGRLASEEAKLLRKHVADVYRETSAALVYEGRTGASPREMKAVMLNAAQQETACLTAECVLRELADLVQETTVYDFLRQEPQGPGYFDHKGFLETARDWYLERTDEEVKTAMGLVEEASYLDLFGRYIDQVTHAVRKEKIRNTVTGKTEDPDEKLMREVERIIEVSADVEKFRQGIMSKIGAWSIDHPGKNRTTVGFFPITSCGYVIATSRNNTSEFANG